MSLLAKCPDPDCDCEEFITIAHVSQDWKVDKHGDFRDISLHCVDVTHEPSKFNTWTCAECGATATVEEV